MMRDLFYCLLLFGACTSEAVRLRAALNSPDPETRMAAAKRLGELGDKPAVPRLCELLEDSLPAVRAEAANALGRIADRRSIEPLAVAVGREEFEAVARVEVAALAAHGGPASEALVGLLISRRSIVRAMAARSLGKLKARVAVTPLIGLLDDTDARVSKSAAYALRRIGDARGVEALAQRVETRVSGDEAVEDALGGRGYEEQLNEARRLTRLGIH